MEPSEQKQRGFEDVHVLVSECLSVRMFYCGPAIVYNSVNGQLFEERLCQTRLHIDCMRTFIIRCRVLSTVYIEVHGILGVPELLYTLWCLIVVSE